MCDDGEKAQKLARCIWRGLHGPIMGIKVESGISCFSNFSNFRGKKIIISLKLS